jgi:hypothetical protein
MGLDRKLVNIELDKYGQWSTEDSVVRSLTFQMISRKQRQCQKEPIFRNNNQSKLE